MKHIFVFLVFVCVFSLYTNAQNSDQPVLITFKDGATLDAIHFGQINCGKDIFSDDYIIVRGKYLGTVTEIKEYRDIEKIILEGFTSPPAVSTGNEKGIVRIFKKNGVSVTLDEAEIAMSCYGPGDKYNELVVKIMNPLTNQAAEKTLETKEIQSVIFK